MQELDTKADVQAPPAPGPPTIVQFVSKPPAKATTASVMRPAEQQIPKSGKSLSQTPNSRKQKYWSWPPAVVPSAASADSVNILTADTPLDSPAPTFDITPAVAPVSVAAEKKPSVVAPLVPPVITPVVVKRASVPPVIAPVTVTADAYAHTADAQGQAQAQAQVDPEAGKRKRKAKAPSAAPVTEEAAESRSWLDYMGLKRRRKGSKPPTSAAPVV